MGKVIQKDKKALSYDESVRWLLVELSRFERFMVDRPMGKVLNYENLKYIDKRKSELARTLPTPPRKED